MKALLSNILGSKCILLATILLFVSCHDDDIEPLDPVVPEGAVDIGIIMTREDGSTYKLYWAESNLSESGLCPKPEDLGDYFAWGETEPYYAKGHSQDNPCTDWREGNTGYYWDSYKWCNVDNYKLTRYCPQDKTDDWGGKGNPDNKTEFRDYDYADDAARAILKGKWRMPTRAEWDALGEQCTWNWINVNGVLGFQVLANNGNSIFIPAAGFREDGVIKEVGDSSNYWSSSSDTEYPTYAWYLFTHKSHYVGGFHSSRYYGHSIRPVIEE